MATEPSENLLTERREKDVQGNEDDRKFRVISWVNVLCFQ
jgi:hypothetical protein